MLAQTIKIAEFSVEEHDYLTEYVDFKSGKAENGAKYLVYNRQKKLLAIVRDIMKNELTELERNIAIEHWCNEVSAGELTQKYGVSRSNLYRILDNARKKLETSLKYVLKYDKILLPKSTEEILEYVRKYEN